MSYRPRPSPLHAAGPAVAILWCAALLTAALTSANPLWLGALALVVLAAGALAGVGRELRACLRFALPLALSVCVINALLTRDGLTVIWRFGDLPVLGQTDITLQATVYGATLGLRAVAIVLVAALYSAAVDPDDVLGLMRRFSFSSALSAAIATRMVPVLIRDSHRLAEAQRCRPGPAPGRVALLHATTAGVVDRALDIAATLEVRGYALAARNRSAPGGRGSSRRPWRWSGPAGSSRHDIGFVASALTVIAAALSSRLAGWVGFDAYPRLALGHPAPTLAASLVLAAAAVAPLLDRRGVSR